MKIVSLQSVGLGAVAFDGVTWRNQPSTFTLGRPVLDPDGNGYEDNITVTEIAHLSDYLTNKEAYDILPDYYKVHTSDGHIRVLPADKYIAEWGE